MAKGQDSILWSIYCNNYLASEFSICDGVWIDPSLAASKKNIIPNTAIVTMKIASDVRAQLTPRNAFAVSSRTTTSWASTFITSFDIRSPPKREGGEPSEHYWCGCSRCDSVPANWVNSIIVRPQPIVGTMAYKTNMFLTLPDLHFPFRHSMYRPIFRFANGCRSRCRRVNNLSISFPAIPARYT